MSEDEKPPSKKRSYKKEAPKYLEVRAERGISAPRTALERNKKLNENKNFVLDKGKHGFMQIVGLSEQGEKLLFEKAQVGSHFNAIAYHLGITVKVFKELQKRLPIINEILEWAHGLLHDEHFAVIREASLNGEAKPMTNTFFVLGNRFGHKQGDDRIAGEKKEGGVQNFNVQVINLPASMTRDDYNKMMDDPEQAKKFLDVTTTAIAVPVKSDEPDSTD